MAGIYIHIPYCKQACTYCNFHFSTNQKNKKELLQALHREIDLRYPYLKDQNIQTIYLGGGTPSILTAAEIKSILDHMNEYFIIDANVECTLEANPDDLHPNYIDQLNQIGVNRLSIGIQSFFEEDMKYMHRAHTPEQSTEAIRNAIQGGIHNISIDLIYGSPTTSMDHWKKNLDTAFNFDIKHLSCYALTVEPRTTLAHQIEKKKAIAPDDHHTILQLEYLMEIAPSVGYEQYEISNFSKQGYRSRHNSQYWLGAHYLGFGPAAHSYDGNSRQWNVANNNQYIQAIGQSKLYFESEDLTPVMKYNEYILTRLRTVEGISIQMIEEPYLSHLNKQIIKWIEDKYLIIRNGDIVLSPQGIFIADRISADLFF